MHSDSSAALSERDLRDVARLLSRASSALFITGAGLSAESGLPTYRGVGGLYERAVTDEGIPIEVALSGPMFQRRPELTWRYLSQLERACRAAAPSPAHRRLAALERALPRAWVLTQNVDGLHLAAGSRNVIEIHGNIHRFRCPACGHRQHIPQDDDARTWEPPCPRCARPLRPDVVLFEEELPRDQLTLYQRELARGFDLLFAIGTTAAFPYIADPVIQAAREGVPTVEINPGETVLSHFVTYRFASPAGVVLEALSAALSPR